MDFTRIVLSIILSQLDMTLGLEITGHGPWATWIGSDYSVRPECSVSA